MNKLFSTLLGLLISISIFAQKNHWLIETANKQGDAIQMALDLESLRDQLSATVPFHFQLSKNTNPQTVYFPNPDGIFDVYDVFKTSVMHPELEKKFPLIRTYIGLSKSIPGKTIRFHLSHKQLAGMIMSPGSESIYINKTEENDYISFYKSDYKRTNFEAFTCGVASTNDSQTKKSNAAAKLGGDCNLRTYRLALACTGEYANYHGGTLNDVMDAMVTAMVRVNGIYETDAGITMQLIANNDDIIFFNSNTDPYTNNSGGQMLGQNQETLDDIIGTENYDIGHVFSTGGGGIANLEAPCHPNRKARGVTGLNNPIGDPFYVDYVSHEMGHQFGGNHTQNNNCQRNPSTAMEPGSASTIMGYAGICNPNVQNNSDDHFHAVSLQEIYDFSTVGNGNGCPVISDTGNNPPTLSIEKTEFFLPVDTPFRLTAQGSDDDKGDALTYCWEQMDNEIADMPPSPFNSGGPAFRSISPTTNPTRYFPNINSILNNTTPTWEVLPIVTRDMNFRCTLRDNHPLNGCTDEVDVELHFIEQAGPFTVTSQNLPESWFAFSEQTITWDVASTTAAPIDCQNVDILLSIDAGQNYDIMLSASEVNDGEAVIMVPNVSSDAARIMVAGADNVFFDINDRNITILSTNFLLSLDPSTINTCDSDSANFTVDYLPIDPFDETVSLSINNLPAGLDAQLSISEVNTASQFNLAVTGISSLDPGSYSFEIQGASSAQNYIANATLNVYTSTLATPELVFPENGITGVAIRPEFEWMTSGNVEAYNLEIASDPSFSAESIVQSYADFNSGSSINADLERNSVYYWRSTASNPCALEAVTSEIFSFQTGKEICTDYPGLIAPLTISPTSASTVKSLTNVDPDVSISTLKVSTEINHSFVGDLVINLEAPNGSTSNLINRPGAPETPQGCAEDNLRITLDDNASNSYLDLEATCNTDGDYALDGEFQPSDKLSVYNGSSSKGIWFLEIQDFKDEDGGEMLNWTLTVCSLVPDTASLVLTNELLPVTRTVRTVITSDYLHTEDMDPAAVRYTLVRRPAVGTLALMNDAMEDIELIVGDTFTQQDINEAALSYTSFEVNDEFDDFGFDVINAESVWSGNNDFLIQINAAALEGSASIASEVSCFNFSDGSILVDVTGGNMPYSYSLDGIDFQDENLFENLLAGEYTIVVRDDDSQEIMTAPITLTNPEPISINVDQDGYTITVIPEGGTGNYQYSLDGINYQDSPVFVVPGEGDYLAIVQDSNGCLGQQDFFVMASAVNEINFDLDISISPNPSDGIFLLNMKSSTTQNIKLLVYSIEGKKLSVESIKLVGELNQTIDVSDQSNGHYLLIIENDSGKRNSYQLIKQ